MCRRGLLDALKFREEPPEAVFLFGIGRGNERNITCAPGFVNINVNFRLTPGGPDGIPEQPTGARRLCGIAGPAKFDHTRASRDQSQLHAIAVNEVTGDGQVRQDDAHYNDHFGLPFFSLRRRKVGPCIRGFGPQSPRRAAALSLPLMRRTHNAPSPSSAILDRKINHYFNVTSLNVKRLLGSALARLIASPRRKRVAAGAIADQFPLTGPERQ